MMLSQSIACNVQPTHVFNARTAPNAAARRSCIIVRSSATTSETKEGLKLSANDYERFRVAEGQLQDVASAGFAALLRGGLGAFSLGYKSSFVQQDPQTSTKKPYTLFNLPFNFIIKETTAANRHRRPDEPIIIYDVQNSPGSRKVREAISILDLSALIYPCPENGPTWSAALSQHKSGASPPYMIDNNTGFELDNADDIVAYLYRTYGNNRIPLLLKPGILSEKTAEWGMAARKGAGSVYSPSTKPDIPLEFYSYEASPFCVLVQETLSELELPYIHRSVARGSSRRQEIVDRHGHFQAPYLEDPNNGVAMFESVDIINYLKKTYGK